MTMKAIAILTMCGLLAAAAATSDASGHWEGKIQLPGRELGMTVDLARNAQGAWVGSMSLLGSSAADVPLEKLTVRDTAVNFAAYLPDFASFEGRLSEDRGGLSGTASNASGGVPFRLARTGEAHVNVPPPNSVLSKEFDGVWEGALAEDGKTLRVRLKLTPGADGLATASLTSVDQGSQEIPVTTVTIEGQQLQVEARGVSGIYKGTLGANGEIAGEWSQGPNHLPLRFHRAARP
jgi:hypothetical protein